MEKESNSTGWYLVAALASVAIGMAIAPAKGSDTRRKLLNKAKNFKNNLGPVKFITRLNKEKKATEAFLSNVHSSSNPLST